LPEAILRLIEIQSGISINVDHIDGIKDTGDTCEVYVGNHTYLCTLPYNTLLQMLNAKDVVDRGLSKDEEMARTMEKVEKVLEKSQHWVG
jgi:hypothetical protein